MLSKPAPRLKEVSTGQGHMSACHHAIDKMSAPAKLKDEKVRTVKEIVHEHNPQDVILDVQNLKVSFPIIKG
jgi:hypothetical protein